MKPEIWDYFPGTWKAYTEDREHMRKLRAMNDVEHHCTYHNIHDRNYYGEDFVFPTCKYDAVAKVLGLPPRKKNANRVADGRKRAKTNKEHRFKSMETSGARR